MTSTQDRPPSRNVEVVQRIYAAFRARDLAAAFAVIAPDITLYQSSAVPWGGHRTGHQGFEDLFASLTAVIDSAVTLERCIDAGDHVVAVGRTRGTVHASGARFDVPVAHVWTLRDGVAVGVQYFIDHPPMLAALACGPTEAGPETGTGPATARRPTAR